MGKDSAKLYAIIGTILFAICCVALVVFRDLPGAILSAGSLAIASLTICYVGINGIKSADSTSDLMSATCDEVIHKEREAAMTLSFLPGFGHRYLTGKIKIIQTIIFVISLLVIFVGLLITSEILSIEWIVGWIIVCYGFIILFFSWVWSALEVNDLCNVAKLPNPGGIFSMKWEKTRLGLFILYLVTYVILVGISIVWGYYYSQYLNLSILVISLSTLLPIALVVDVLKEKNISS